MKNPIVKYVHSQPLKIRASIITVIILLCAAIIALLFPPRIQSVVSQFQVENLSQLPPIQPGAVVTQEFESTDDFSGFGLLFASYQQILDHGSIEIDIYNHQQEIVDTCSVEARNLMDLSFLHCNASLAKGQQYKLVISTENLSSSVTFLTTETHIDNTALAINKKTQDNLIVMDFTEQRGDYMLAWCFAVLANLVICYIVANIEKGSSNDSEKVR